MYPELNGLKITEIKFTDLVSCAKSKMLPCDFYLVLNNFILLSGTLVQFPARISIKYPANCNPGNWIPVGDTIEDIRARDWLREAVLKAWKDLPFPEIPPKE